MIYRKIPNDFYLKSVRVNFLLIIFFVSAGTSGVAGILPWGPAAPPVVMRNLMDMVAGYMARSAAAVTTVATTTSTATPTSCLRQRVAAGVGGGAAPNPAQSTQARWA